MEKKISSEQQAVLEHIKWLRENGVDVDFIADFNADHADWIKKVQTGKPRPMFEEKT